jgi:hypothetical protein
MATQAKKSTWTRRNAGEIRRSQLITTYGPGAMVDLKDDAALIQAVDGWKGTEFQPENETLRDPRLLDLINSMLSRLDPPVALEVRQPFISPPVPSDDHSAPNQSKVGVSATTFPLWFVCQACNQLHRAESMRQKHGQNLHTCTVGEERSRRSVPVRFVVACKDGHLDEFPWNFFVHATGEDGKSRCRSHQLYLIDESADLSTARVECRECGARRSMMDAFANDKALGLCSGNRPWIPGYLKAGRVKCEQQARPLVRTASNSWYSVIASALQLDRENASLSAIQAAIPLQDEVFAGYRAMPLSSEQIWAVTQPLLAGLMEQFPAERVKEAFVARLEQRALPASAVSIRAPEYRTLVAAPAFEHGATEGTRARDPGPSMIANALPDVPTGIGRVVQVDLLQELRAQIGFTRMHPCPPLDESSGAAPPDGLQLAFDKIGRLPAVLNRGEGIFFSLDPTRVTEWEQRDAVVERVRVLNGSETGNERPARYYLLHTLSHLLMESLGTYCGYASTALRERLYWSEPDEEFMAGVLIMTATPGTDGTLGGLAEQAASLGMHLRRVRSRALLCSNDPVCSTHPQPRPAGQAAGGHVHRPYEGAACYACCYVAEPSCEAFNRYLDRALVFPVIGQLPELAYFGMNEEF